MCGNQPILNNKKKLLMIIENQITKTGENEGKMKNFNQKSRKNVEVRTEMD